jgi:hypothetical protein
MLMPGGTFSRGRRREVQQNGGCRPAMSSINGYWSLRKRCASAVGQPHTAHMFAIEGKFLVCYICDVCV